MNTPDHARPLALVTGASAGIGAEFARQFAARGYDLALTARRRDRLDELAASLKTRHQIECLVIEGDLAEPETPAVILEAVESAGRRVDVLVNNAGYAVPGAFTTAEWKDHRDFIQVMITAVAELSYRCLPAMKESGRGGIINVASLAGIVAGTAGHTLYGAVKAWMIKFSESLAMEYDGTGVNIQALCPGFTYSEFHDVIGMRESVSKLPDYMWMSAGDVVAIGLDRFGQRNAPVMVVPGRWNRFLAALSRKLPYRVAFNMVRRRSRKFRHRE
ncbi:MAG: SDR family oxidoreductase [Wenzhouxiangellaceae bacterium]|nr:SDR family oxidoreductase [Wenzhouxiangellaceae bacterium]